MLAFALMLPLCFCGCFGGNETDELQKTLSYPFRLTAETGELSFELTLEGNGKASAKMTSPRTLSGLDLVKDGDKLTASYKGMTVPLPEASAKKVFALTDILDSVIASFADGSYVIEKGDNASTISVTCGDAVCIITYEGGNITSAEINCGGKRTVYNITSEAIVKPSASEASVNEASNSSKEITSDVEKSG